MPESDPPIGTPDGTSERILDSGATRRAFLTGLTATAAVVALGPAGRAMAAGPGGAGQQIPQPVPVALTYDLNGVSTLADPGAANFDGVGWSFPAEQMPTGAVTVGGIPFTFPAKYGDGSKNFVSCTGQTIAMPEGPLSVIYVIGSAGNGDCDAKATIDYADGTSDTVPFQLTDWAQSPHFGEVVAVQCDHRHNASGNDSPPVALFMQTLAADPKKKVKGLTLPTNAHGKVIAISVQPSVAGVAVRALGAGSTELFVGTEQQPLQVVRVSLLSVGTDPVTATSPITVSVSGGATSPRPTTITDLKPGMTVNADVGVVVPGGKPEGTVVHAEVTVQSGAASSVQAVDIVVAVPGWTMYMVSHYHYDPVWWNTQGAFTETWQNTGRQRNVFELVHAHLDMARRDPDYKFVLAETDYLKPYWSSFPEDRDFIRQLISAGRLEYVGGMYNEPSPVLTSAELTIRNVVQGFGYQRDVLGGRPESAWMLDVFGHDPQFPGICADAGLTSSSWARGPHHEWGPKASVGTNTRMQFSSEFDWVAPSGKALLTSYMPNHYSAGWSIDGAASLEAAMAQAYKTFGDLKPVAATKNVLLPVGTDHVPPNRWVTQIHREWNKRYVWPRFKTAIARDFFDAVRTEAKTTALRFSPQTRDMNPIFTGCYITYIDTKQAQREAETTLMSAEKFATVAALLGARYPSEAFDKAWRQLCFGAHHDAVTGSESDQVYLDLLGGWREALELGSTALRNAQDHIAGNVDTRGRGTPILVFNPMSWQRTDVVWAEAGFAAPGPLGVTLADPRGRHADFHVDAVERHPDGTIARLRIGFVAAGVPATGYATYRLLPTGKAIAGTTWTTATGNAIENEHYRIEVDPAKGGAITRLLDKDAGKEMLRPGGLANELLAYEEYQNGPGAPTGGPWVTVQKGGPVASTADKPADVLVQTCPIGARITVGSPFAGCDRVQEIMVWHGLDRVDLSTRIDGYTGSDRLLRVRFQPAVTGGMPVAETAAAVTGRTFGFPNNDFAKTIWTLDYAASNWFALGSTLTVRLSSGAARAVSVGELIVPDPQSYDTEARAAVTALVRRGVTATTSKHDGSRYGSLDVDSNLPDFRISVGGPAENAFTKAVLAAAGKAYQAEFDRQLAAGGEVRLWVPGAKALKEVWVVHADLRDPAALPVLIVAGHGHPGGRQALRDLTADLDRAPVIEVRQDKSLDGTTGTVEPYGFAVVNRGMPGFNVEVSGDLYLGIMRSSTGWPSGAWIDAPQRYLPDGAGFQTNHWSHTFQYSLIGHRGDWRDAGLPRRGHEVNNPLGSRTTGPHAGRLPASAALLEADGTAIVTALKPRGNPMASRGGPDHDPAEGIVIRAYESHGTSVQTRLRFFRELQRPSKLTVLETGDSQIDAPGGEAALTLDGFEIATVSARPVLHPDERAAAAARPQLAPAAEIAQPVYAQYWRHNKGAAPMGGQPLAVRLTPDAVVGTGPYQMTVSVASESTQGPIAGTVKLVLPDGWSADSSQRPFNLAPGAWLVFTTTVGPAGGAAKGRYFVAAQVTDELGTVHESVAAVEVASGTAMRAASGAQAGLPGGLTTVPIPPQDPYDDSLLVLRADRVTRKAQLVKPAPGRTPMLVAPQGELNVDWAAPAVLMRPGQKATAVVKLSNQTHSPIHGEAQLVAPYALWPMAGPWTQGFSVPAASPGQVAVDIAVPADARPGKWWALMKLMYFGRIQYTKSIEIRVVLDPVVLQAAPLALGTGQTADLTLTVVGLADDPVSGTLALTVPSGWTAPASVPFGPVHKGESVPVKVQVQAPATAAPGQYQITVAATGGGHTVSTVVPVSLIGTSIDFMTGTQAEAPWLFDAGTSQLDGQGRRYADNDHYWIYWFPLPKDTKAGKVTLHIDNEFLVQAGTDGQNWTEVIRETNQVHDGSNVADRSIDLAPYLTAGAIYVRVSDSFPADGWGGRVDHVVVSLQRGA